MKNQEIEEFIANNLYRFLELGKGKTTESVEKLKEIIKILNEKNIIKIEEQLNRPILSLKARILIAQLGFEYAKNILKQERLATLLFAIKNGLEKQFDWD